MPVAPAVEGQQESMPFKMDQCLPGTGARGRVCRPWRGSCSRPATILISYRFKLQYSTPQSLYRTWNRLCSPSSSPSSSRTRCSSLAITCNYSFRQCSRFRSGLRAWCDFLMVASQKMEESLTFLPPLSAACSASSRRTCISFICCSSPLRRRSLC